VVIHDHVPPPMAPQVDEVTQVEQDWCQLCGCYHADMHHVTIRGLQHHDFNHLCELRERNLLDDGHSERHILMDYKVKHGGDHHAHHEHGHEHEFSQGGNYGGHGHWHEHATSGGHGSGYAISHGHGHQNILARSSGHAHTSGQVRTSGHAHSGGQTHSSTHAVSIGYGHSLGHGTSDKKVSFVADHLKGGSTQKYTDHHTQVRSFASTRIAPVTSQMTSSRTGAGSLSRASHSHSY